MTRRHTNRADTVYCAPAALTASTLCSITVQRSVKIAA
ncbi:hypothetical protein I547_3342 [Mycobacterium kansasii 824]|nr:hypothetical protein I547_3342 [Mycobacterium kansasii 824]